MQSQRMGDVEYNGFLCIRSEGLKDIAQPWKVHVAKLLPDADFWNPAMREVEIVDNNDCYGIS
jgi:hypothetical protein